MRDLITTEENRVLALALGCRVSHSESWTCLTRLCTFLCVVLLRAAAWCLLLFTLHFWLRGNLSAAAPLCSVCDTRKQLKCKSPRAPFAVNVLLFFEVRDALSLSSFTPSLATHEAFFDLGRLRLRTGSSLLEDGRRQCVLFDEPSDERAPTIDDDDVV